VFVTDSGHPAADALPARAPTGPVAGEGGLLRVLVVDDHLMVRRGTRRQLKELPELRVVGEAADGFEALALVRTLGPDLVFMDISMPGLDGLEATRRITAEFPSVRVIVLSSHDDVLCYWQARAAGAVGYLLKGHSLETFAADVRKILAES
jgi:DNA-binding NarL/FixJ family response regulator